MADTSKAVVEKAQEREKEESRRRLQERLQNKKSAKAPNTEERTLPETESEEQTGPVPEEAGKQQQQQREAGAEMKQEPEPKREPEAVRQAVCSFFSAISTQAQAALDGFPVGGAPVSHPSEKLAATNFLLSMSSKLAIPAPSPDTTPKEV